jgi:predicted SprT family Zn-dependent metalloprotease
VRDWARYWAAVARRRVGALSAWPARPAAPIGIGLPEEELLARRLAALGLRDLAGVRVTDNRTVIVSLSKRRVLSIHRGYAQASDRVLKAVVRFLSREAPKALRRAAQHEILSFRAELHAEGPPRRRRAADRPRPGDVVHTERLAQLFREANAAHFGGALPELPIRLSGRMRTRLGQLCMSHETNEPFEITVSRRHVERHGWAEVADTLLHEMVHLWQHLQGHAVDHGRQFRFKAREVGVVPAARRSVRRVAPHGRAARYD